MNHFVYGMGSVLDISGQHLMLRPSVPDPLTRRHRVKRVSGVPSPSPLQSIGSDFDKVGQDIRNALMKPFDQTRPPSRV